MDAYDWSTGVYATAVAMAKCMTTEELSRTAILLTQLGTTLGTIAALRELEGDGLVRRQAYPEVPVRVEYSATERCMRLLPVLESLSDWAEAEMDGPEEKFPE